MADQRLITPATFEGDAGKHSGEDGFPCSGRVFDKKFVGVGGMYIDVVVCRHCHRELEAFHNGLVPETRL